MVYVNPAKIIVLIALLRDHIIVIFVLINIKKFKANVYYNVKLIIVIHVRLLMIVQFVRLVMEKN
jgi:hypothetical protein